MKPYAIRFEYGKTDPEGINLFETDKPVISWAVHALNGEEADNARIRVENEKGVLWDTDFVPAPEQKMTYAGEVPTPGEVSTLTVTLKNTDGLEQSQSIRICFAAVEKWNADWITDSEETKGAVLQFCREFDLPIGVRDACAFVCGLGYQKTYLNGQAVSDRPMDPAFSQYEKRAYYNVIPQIGSCLHAGKNRISVRVAAGWRNPGIICYRNMDHIPTYAGKTVLSLMFRVVLTDGTVRWITTDGDWTVSRDRVTYSDIFMGETFDARIMAEKKPCTLTACPTEKLSPQTLEPIREQEVYLPRSVYEIAPGVQIADFGQNLAGVCRLRLPERMAPGARIEIRQIEFLDEDGRLYLPQLRHAAAVDTYIASGDGRDLEVWQPEFTYHGFRYAEISGYPSVLTRDDISAVRLYTDIAKNSDFTCGEPRVNAFYRIAIETEKSNLHSILTDCPQRDERMGWMNDATVRFEAAPYQFDIGRLFPKVVRDLMDVQGKDGTITCTAPFAYGNRPADPVCSSFLVAGYEAWLHTGNDAILAEAYPAFRAWNDYLERRSENGIVDYSYYGDWAGPAYACDDPEGARSAVTPGILMSTGYHYYNAVLLSKMAAILKDESEAEAQRRDAGRIRSSFLKKWYHPDTHTVGVGSQACQAFALWLDILPENERQAAADTLHRELVGSGYRITTGNLCTRYLLEQLARFGYGEDAWRILIRQEYPSFGYMIQNEATTVWERFELKKKCSMNSHNHPMHASSYRWLYAVLLGLEPLEGTWKRFRVKPFLPVDLLSASGSVETPLGDVVLRWVRRYGEIHIYLTVPYGATAQVELPWGERMEVGWGFRHFSHLIPEAGAR